MQNTITNIDKQRFTPFTVGFDDLFDRLFDMEVNTSSGYPPYNIIKSDDYNYHIEIAVAGFNKDQIEVELSDGVLTVRSKIQDHKANETQNIIHPIIVDRLHKLSMLLFQMLSFLQVQYKKMGWLYVLISSNKELNDHILPFLL